MHRFDRISAIFCFFLGLAVFSKGVHLGLRVHIDMGPGFFPLVAGGLLSFLSAVLFFQSLAKKETSAQRIPFWNNPYGWKLVLLAILAISIYPFLLNPFGFLLSTFLLLFFLFRVVAHYKWWAAGMGGIITTAMVYLIFEVWLKAQLPKGLFGF
jgi:putative tricarboxylic transport membrane protein